MTVKTSPIACRDVSFANYLDRKKNRESLHIMGNGVTDYAYSADLELRKKLDSIPHFYSLASKVCGTYTTRQIQVANRSGIAVSGSQFPEIYSIVCSCAKTLGIGVPNTYIINDPVMNASTYCFNDVEPLILVNSGMVERCTPGELKFVLGHECGHIQNLHGVYSAAVNVLTSIGTGGAGALMGAAANLFNQTVAILLNSLSRAMEITCDRAGLICADDPEDCYNALTKLSYGGMIGKEYTVDYKELRKQLDLQRDNISQLDEILSTGHDHPTTIRRVFAAMEFSRCETYFSWRPETRERSQVLFTKKETDELCKKIVSIQGLD
ncbi:MAG: M48 family metallopeptidase [Oscillospiraceae bacterium]